MKTTLALLSKKGENTVPKVLSVLEQMKEASDTKFAVATANGCTSAKDFAKLSTDKLCGIVVLGFASTAPAKSQPQFSQLKEGRLLFDGRIYSPPVEATEFVTKQLDKQAYAQAAHLLLQCTEGEYYLIAAQTNQLVATRDPVGVQPLYYGENAVLAALASDKTSLRKLGLEPKSFPPGHIATVTANGFEFTPSTTLKLEPPKPYTMEQAADKLQILLTESIQIRVAAA
jgi:asparagine synthetase B (glutamine-hydrolysing)